MNNKTIITIGFIWGIPLLFFPLVTVYERADICLVGVITGRTERHFTNSTKTYIEYQVLQEDKQLRSYSAYRNDPSLSRDLRVGSTVSKKQWELTYRVDGQVVDDFPLFFYYTLSIIGACFIGYGVWRIAKKDAEA